MHNVVNVNGTPTPTDVAMCMVLVEIREAINADLAATRVLHDDLNMLREKIESLEERFINPFGKRKG